MERRFKHIGEVVYSKPITAKTAAVICPACSARVHFELVEGQTTHPVICPGCIAGKEVQGHG